MPHNQNIGDKSICCVSCGKVIAKGHISAGKIEIKCKCGVINKIEAEKKPEGQLHSFGVRYGQPDFHGDILMPDAFSKRIVFK